MRTIAAADAARVVVAAVVLLGTGDAVASEGASLHDDVPADPSDVGEDALGTRGLVRSRAEVVSFDARERSLELSGNVRVDAPPFHLRSQHIRLTRTRFGVEVDGNGRLAFCPCLGTPVTIEFDRAIVAPPGELFLRSPKLEIYGIPVAYLPWFWMRSDEKVGLLPPDLAYRGQDGLFLGGGVHLPWKERGTRRSVDLRGGAYLRGGFAVDARLQSPSATTAIRYDRLAGARAPTVPGLGGTSHDASDGLAVDARGASNDERTTVAWDADVLRGRRGVVATTDLEAASKPWDRASLSGAVRLGPVVSEMGVRAVTRRGGDLQAVDAAGPFIALRSSGALASGVAYDVTVEGGSLRVSGAAASLEARRSPSITPDSISYARVEVGALAATSFGPLATSLQARGAGDVAIEGRRDGSDRAATARARVGVPFARASSSSDGAPDRESDPVIHVLEPFAEAAALHARGDALLGSLPGKGLASLEGTAPLADAGIASTLGRWGRHEALEIVAAGGAIHESAGVKPLLRGRLSAALAWLGVQVEAGHVAADEAASRGGAVAGRVRVGRSDGPRLLASVAVRDGLDPILARAVTDPAIEAPAGFLAREGATGGAGLVIPWARAISTSVGADADATSQQLVAARGGIELRDRCNCITLRANGSHRIGRSGVDVWLALDFATDR